MKVNAIEAMLVALIVLAVQGCHCNSKAGDSDIAVQDTAVQDSGMDTTVDSDLLVDGDPGLDGDGPEGYEADGDLPIDGDVTDVDEEPDFAEEYACGPFMEGSARLQRAMLDPFTGLPHDQIVCGTNNPNGIERARLWGVVPQFHSGALDRFCKDGDLLDATVLFSFVDAVLDGPPPSLIYALKIDFHFEEGNEFGGVIWNAKADLSRYDRVLIRYRTSSPEASFEFKLKAEGADEQVAVLAGMPGAGWTDREIDLGVEFAATPLDKINYLVISATLADAGADSTIWIDQVSFMADPAQLDRCDVICPDSPVGWVDKGCDEILSGAANTANALSVFSLRRDVEDDAAEVVQRILGSLLSLAGPSGTTGWFQDWQSPVSLMPDARNRHASITDQPQLYAALMVVETSFADVPGIVAKSEAVRARMDWAAFYDPGIGCPGILYGALDRCEGVFEAWKQNTFATEAALGAWLVVATGAAPACLWNDGLAVNGCEKIAHPLAPDRPWYRSGSACDGPIPATEGGGPFLQLVPLLYLGDDLLPVGPLTMEQSAANMVHAQMEYAATEGLSFWGWSNASHPGECDYMTCEEFDRCLITPHIAALALASSDMSDPALDMLYALSLTGAGLPYDSGTVQHHFGLRDGWDQCIGAGRDAFLYLDTGWSLLGAVNYCKEGLVRERFAAHPVAVSGAEAFEEMTDICSE